MARRRLHDDWVRISGSDIASLDIGAGTVTVAKHTNTPRRVYRLDTVYKQLLRAAYERGLKARPAWGNG